MVAEALLALHFKILNGDSLSSHKGGHWHQAEWWSLNAQTFYDHVDACCGELENLVIRQMQMHFVQNIDNDDLTQAID